MDQIATTRRSKTGKSGTRVQLGPRLPIYKSWGRRWAGTHCTLDIYPRVSLSEKRAGRYAAKPAAPIPNFGIHLLEKVKKTLPFNFCVFQGSK